MAYDALKKHKDDTNPYERLAGPDTSGPATAQVSRTPLALAPKTNDSGPTATGYVNFDSLYNANSGVAQREATQRADSAQAKAKAAQQGLTGAQNQFNSQLAGASYAPTAQQQTAAQYGPTGVDQGKKVVGAYLTQGQSNVLDHGKQGDAAGVRHDGSEMDTIAPGETQSYMTEEQQLDESPVLPPKRDANGNPVPGTGYPPYDPSKPNETQDVLDASKQDPAATEAALRAGAAQKYGGPLALSSDSNAYAKLLGDTTAAQDEINSPLTGMNQTDAALLGAAGRPRFAQEQQRYGHLVDDLTKANAASYQKGIAAQTHVPGDAAAYQKLLDEYEGRVGADKATADDAFKSSEGVITKARQDSIDKSNYNDYLHPSAGDQIRNGLHKGAEYLNPIDWVARAIGGPTITQRSTDYLGGAGGPDNPGNRSEAWGQDDGDVYASMQPADWAEFNGLGIEAQYAWIAARKKKLRGGK